MKKMAYSRLVFKLITVVGLGITLSCCEKPNASSYYTRKCPNSQVAPNEASAKARAVGRWRLIWLAPGAGTHTKPNDKIELVINNQLEGTLYQNSREVSRYQFQLQQVQNVVRYTIVNQLVSSEYVPYKEGIFRVCDKELIVGDSYRDGVDHIYDRVKR
jgi:hypothetical protein